MAPSNHCKCNCTAAPWGFIESARSGDRWMRSALVVEQSAARELADARGRVLSGSYRDSMDSSTRRSARDPAPSAWNVLWHQPAVVELHQIKELKSRKAVLSVADILRQLGPRLVEP